MSQLLAYPYKYSLLEAMPLSDLGSKKTRNKPTQEQDNLVILASRETTDNEIGFAWGRGSLLLNNPWVAGDNKRLPCDCFDNSYVERDLPNVPL